MDSPTLRTPKALIYNGLREQSCWNWLDGSYASDSEIALYLSASVETS